MIAKEKKAQKNSIQKGGNSEIVAEENWYSLVRAALFLDVSVNTVRFHA